MSLIPPLASIWIRLTRATMRIRRENFGVLSDLSRGGKPCILAFWHGRMFLMPYSYRGTRVTILISEHRDGEYISRTMKRFGFATARGSSTRSGAIGLREILRALRHGADVAFTPDGPRGPRETVQPGVIAAARLSGAPIVPLTFACSKKNF
ncbi:MAG: lysophospholipid acyltransferase family protein [Acidobacteria bacterium]|nr:lysophospholipid acyltransferase family protein [Acidobacteriota bacterium]